MAGAYTHHGVYVGNGQIIHYSGEVGSKRDAAIKRTSVAGFLEGGEAEVVKYARSFDPDSVIQRAESRLGEDGYDLFGNNCEHFARWCVTGDARSEQVRDVASAASGASAGAAATAAGIGVVSAGGAVAGLSGAGVMSGLATVGGVVGGGAVAGVAVLAAAPAAISTVAMRQVLSDDTALAGDEREARTVGRTATAVGGVAGTVGSVAAISAAGVSGLSAVGITSGLAAIGGTVGGGMVAGAAIAIAAPAVAAAGIGYGAYRAWKWINS
jgi:hypothetical protein